MLDSTVNFRDAKDTLETLPLEQFDIYQIALDRINAATGSPGMRILGFPLHSRAALTVRALQHALATRLKDKSFDADGMMSPKDILLHTFGLLTIQGPEIKFYHYTALEFLKQEHIYDKYFSTFEEDLSRTCLTYLRFSDFSQPSNELEKRHQEFPFLEYAASHVGDHARKALARAARKGSSSTLLVEISGFVQDDKPLGTLQIFASKVLTMPRSDRMKYWKNTTSKLHFAICAGLNDTVDQLLQQQENVETLINLRGYKKETPVHMAARAANEDALQTLIDKGADIQIKNGSGKNALDMILDAPYTKAVLEPHSHSLSEYLLGMVFMHASASEASAEKTKIEEEVFADVKAKGIDGFLRSIDQTDSDTNKSMLKRILTAKAAMDITDQEEKVALKLIEHGIKHNAVGTQQETPLQMAALYGREAIVRSLLEKGANPWLDWNLGYTPLELAKARPGVGTTGNDSIIQLISDTMKALKAAEDAATDDAEKRSESWLHPG
ncbi:ankyrin [Apiospora kogelbergensis]|uniref:Ankyrin n=1 Tax=Apiospora kogelbergensis TaxID=1337665 RepID=A0AAW0R233_9PEZI